MNGENGILKNQFHIETMYAQYRKNGGNSMIRRNLVLLSGRIEWKANDVRNVTFQNGSSETFYKVRISSKRNTKKDADAALKAFTEVIEETLKAGDSIQLIGFGTFEVAERAERTGRNPQTGAEMVIPASKAPKFKAGKALKDALN